jgi:peptide/nickel transport system permease protein
MIARPEAPFDRWRRSGGWLGVVVLVGMIAVALVGPLALPDPASQPDIVAGAQPPSLAHPFGTDVLSRDVLSRVVSGARISLAIAALAVTLSLVLGATFGLVAGYWGGWVDTVLMRLVDGALAIPRLFLLLLLVTVWDQLTIVPFVLVIGATGWFGTSRLVRAEVLRIKSEPFVQAAQALGAKPARIVRRHLLPNTAGPLLVAATLGVGNVILLEAGLSFLGVGGVRPPTPSWGRMIFEGKSVLATAPWTSIFPGVAIVVTVLAVNLIGEALRDHLDPKNA